jgi:glutathione S-transferase
MRRLLTIPISHYCEKARWALERAGIEYAEERHVQGLHIAVSRRAGGHGTLPVLICEDGVLGESEAILRWADSRLPAERRLFPDGDGEVAALCRRLDEGLGPDGRRLMYARMLPHRRLMLRYNDHGVPPWEDRLLRTLWPAMTRFAARRLALRDDTVERDTARVQAVFDEIGERRADGRRYLCGDRFTAADLTFAALAAAVLVPPEYGTPLPQPDELPEPVASEVRAFRAHPAGAFALALFRDERRAAAA